MREPTRRRQPQIPRGCGRGHYEIRNLPAKDGGAPRRQTRRAQAARKRKPDEILALVKQVLWCLAAVAVIATCVFLWAWAVPTVDGAVADVQRLEAEYAQR